jgi:hypothetical protein
MTGIGVPTTAVQDATSYRLAWETFQRLNRNATAAAVGVVAIPFVTILFLVASSGTHPSGPTENVVLTVAGFALFILVLAATYTRWQLSQWPCPRCGNRFHRYSFVFPWGMYFQTGCVHCKLPVWSDYRQP